MFTPKTPGDPEFRVNLSTTETQLLRGQRREDSLDFFRVPGQSLLTLRVTEAIVIRHYSTDGTEQTDYVYIHSFIWRMLDLFAQCAIPVLLRTIALPPG
jgi:hypothetical protein